MSLSCNARTTLLGNIGHSCNILCNTNRDTERGAAQEKLGGTSARTGVCVCVCVCVHVHESVRLYLCVLCLWVRLCVPIFVIINTTVSHRCNNLRMTKKGEWRRRFDDKNQCCYNNGGEQQQRIDPIL
jgi:hypothetical protein